MDATQQIEDTYSEEEEDETKEKQEGPEKEQVATLKVFKNDHIPETEFPLYIGENVLGRDPAFCSVSLPARSVSSRHAVISISVFRSCNNRSNDIETIEALLWDMGSLNGTRKGRLKLTPQVRYALAEGDSVVLADVPCQYISLHVPNKHANIGPEDKVASKHEKQRSPSLSSSDSEPKLRKGVVNEKKRGNLPPVPLWSDEDEEPKNATSLCSPLPANKQPEITLVPDSDSGSDGESAIDERRDLVSDSASSSNLVSPSDSTFLTPGRKVIPESEDESSITPSSAAMDRFKLKDSFSVDCSDSSKTGPLALNLDSDTDIEEEETERSMTGSEAQIEVASKVQPVSSADLHMDSDTDVEEEEMEKSKTEPDAQTKETRNLKSVASADLHMDSDTDVEEEETEKSKTEQEPQTKEAPKVECVTSPDPHMDSDTDVEESDASNELPKVLAVPESPPSAPPNANIHLDSDTDVEDDNPMAVPMVAEVSHPVVRDSDIRPIPNPGTEFCMDSDTDVDEEDKDKKAGDPLSNSDTDDEDPFKSLPGKTVNVAANQKTTSDSECSKVEQSDKGTHKQIHPIQTHTSHEEPTQAFDSPEDWDLQPTQAYGVIGASAGLRPKQLDLEATQAYEAETDREEEEKEPLSHNEMYSNLSTAETHDDEEMHDYSHLSTADTLIIASTPRREEQTQHFALFSAPTQLLWEGEEKGVDQSEPAQVVEADTIDETQDDEEDEENIKWDKRKTHVGRKMPKHKNISSSHIFIAETQPMCEDEDASDECLSSAVSSSDTDHERKHHKKEPFISNVAIAETQPMCEDEEASDEGLNSAVSSSDTDHKRKHHKEEPFISNVAIAETQPMCEDEEASDEGLNSAVSSSDTDHKRKHHKEEPFISNFAIAETQPMCEDEEASEEGLNSAVNNRDTDDKPKHLQGEPSSSNVAIAETQPMSEEEQTINEDLKSGVNSGRPKSRQQAEEHKSTQLADKSSTSHLTIAETQPMCEDQEEPDEGLSNAVSSVPTGQDEAIHFTEKPLRSHVTIAETQPMSDEEQPAITFTETQPISEEAPKQLQKTQPVDEEDEGQDKDLKSKMPSRRSRRGRPKKEEVAQAAETVVHHTIATTEPICEEEDEKDEEQNIELKSRRSTRGRPIKKDEIPQPLAETKPVPEENNDGEDLNSGIRSKRSCRRKQRDELEPKFNLNIVETQPVTEGNIQEEPANAGSSCQGRQPRGRRQMKEKTDQENEAGASTKGPGRARKGQVGKRKRGNALSENEEKSEEEKTRMRTKRTGLKQKCDEKEGDEELEMNAQEEKENIEKELQEQEERERLEREENERLECERKEREERKAKERVEREQKKLEEKEQLKREEEERIRKEKEEHEAMERLKREAEEKDRLERELKDKLERQQLKKEEEERIQREKREKEQKDKLEKEKEHLQRLEAERKQLEKERQENERLEMTAKAQLNREQKEKEERNQQERQKNKTLKEKNAELNAPPVSSNDDAPARRTRRHSNSSMNSEQSVASQQEQPSQRGRGRGRGRSRGRQTGNEQPISGRQTGRRKTIPGPADGLEDTELDSTPRSRSRSSSRSSERSSNSSRTPNQSARGRGRKSVKLPQPEEEVSQAKTPGKGRGKGGRGSKVDNINVESSKCEQDAEVAEEDVKPQTNSRGRKRAATASTSSVDTPPPTPKTPRRSVASQMPKVLFTGLTDEDGERVVARLGGSLAKGVNDMTHLVTDKARRTVKFLCAVARGVPIVTPDWLKKCGKASSFLSADEHLLKDVEQEKKFNFSLQAALQAALHQPLLNGYEIHVTKSVMPEPSQMKEIITCCGARFLPKMPSTHKEHTVVVSCEQDRALCAKALSLSLPVVSTEFLLTGILQQKVDLQAYALTFTLNTTNQPTAPKTPSRGRRK